MKQRRVSELSAVLWSAVLTLEFGLMCRGEDASAANPWAMEICRFRSGRISARHFLYSEIAIGTVAEIMEVLGSRRCRDRFRPALRGNQWGRRVQEAAARRGSESFCQS
jgi:hypothetical protein